MLGGAAIGCTYVSGRIQAGSRFSTSASRVTMFKQLALDLLLALFASSAFAFSCPGLI